MTIFRGTVLDTPDDPFAGGLLRAHQDAGMLVTDGVIAERADYADVRRRHPDEQVVDLSAGLVLPGFIDTHVHFPQVRSIGALGMPLLEWLERSALPEEARLTDIDYARSVATDFVSGLIRAGTTTALVFGSHFSGAVDALFAETSRVGLRISSGLVVSDRMLRDDLLTTPERAYDESRALAERWDGVGRNRYVVTPRFALSCTDAMLDVCGSLLADVAGAGFTSHINENQAEIAAVAGLFDDCEDYVTCYDQHDLLSRRSVLAHNVHPTDAELKLLAEREVGVAHCPTSNAALGSGIFPLGRHIEAGVRFALGSDVGAGTGFSLYKEGLQAYFLQRLAGSMDPAGGYPLTAAHLLHLATAAGADLLGLADQVGRFNAGHRFDAQWLRPDPGSTLDVGLRHAADPDDALARAFALASPADVAGVWIDGERISG